MTPIIYLRERQQHLSCAYALGTDAKQQSSGCSLLFTYDNCIVLIYKITLTITNINAADVRIATRAQNI